MTSTSFDFSSAPAGLTGPSGLEWDSATGLLYGYAWNPTSSEEAFVSIDPANGMVSNIGAIPQITGVTQGESTFGGSYFYFKGSDGSGGNTFLVGVQLP